jgi:hypothetical protein
MRRNLKGLNIEARMCEDTATLGGSMVVKHTMVFVVSVVACCFWGSSASAQPAPPVPARGANQAGPRLTPEQMKAFAELTGDSPGKISSRMAIDPNLAQIAAPAADERISRKRVGMALTIIGFGILGVGDIVGSAIMVTTPGYPVAANMSGHMGRFYLGLGIGLASMAVGLAMGIPGIMKIARESEEEQRALDYYSPSRPDLSLQNSQAQVLGKTLVTPVVSLAF